MLCSYLLLIILVSRKRFYILWYSQRECIFYVIIVYYCFYCFSLECLNKNKYIGFNDFSVSQFWTSPASGLVLPTVNRHWLVKSSSATLNSRWPSHTGHTWSSDPDRRVHWADKDCNIPALPHPLHITLTSHHITRIIHILHTLPVDRTPDPWGWNAATPTRATSAGRFPGRSSVIGNIVLRWPLDMLSTVVRGSMELATWSTSSWSSPQTRPRRRQAEVSWRHVTSRARYNSVTVQASVSNVTSGVKTVRRRDREREMKRSDYVIDSRSCHAMHCNPSLLTSSLNHAYEPLSGLPICQPTCLKHRPNCIALSSSLLTLSLSPILDPNSVNLPITHHLVKSQPVPVYSTLHAPPIRWNARRMWDEHGKLNVKYSIDECNIFCNCPTYAVALSTYAAQNHRTTSIYVIFCFWLIFLQIVSWMQGRIQRVCLEWANPHFPLTLPSLPSLPPPLHYAALLLPSPLPPLLPLLPCRKWVRNFTPGHFLNTTLL